MDLAELTIDAHPSASSAAAFSCQHDNIIAGFDAVVDLEAVVGPHREPAFNCASYLVNAPVDGRVGAEPAGLNPFDLGVQPGDPPLPVACDVSLDAVSHELQVRLGHRAEYPRKAG